MGKMVTTLRGAPENLAFKRCPYFDPSQVKMHECVEGIKISCAKLPCFSKQLAPNHRKEI